MAQHTRRQCGVALTLLALTVLEGCAQDRAEDAASAAVGPGTTQSVLQPGDAGWRDPVDPEGLRTLVVDVPPTGIELGWGWNSRVDTPRHVQCVEFAPAEAPAQTKFLSMYEVTDTYELSQRMGASASVSVKAFGARASGQAKFAKEASVSSFGSNFVLQTTIDNGVRYAAPVSENAAGARNDGVIEGRAVNLTAAARRLAERDVVAFERRCGDSFVSAVFSGARLTAVITFSTRSHAEQESFSSKLKASGWGATLDAGFSAASSSQNTTTSSKVSVFQTGGSGDTIPTTKDELMQKLAELPGEALKAPKDFRIAVTPYRLLPNWPPNAGPRGGRIEYEQLAAGLAAYQLLYEDFQTALSDWYARRAGSNGGQAQASAASGGFEAYRRTTCALDDEPASNGEGQDEGGEAAAPVVVDADVPCDANVVDRLPPPGIDLPAACGAGAARPAIEGGTFVSLDEGEAARIEVMQDEVLRTLRKLTQLATACSTEGQTCLFDDERVASPYTYRLRMPLPVVTDVTNDLDLLIAYHVRDPSQRRCDLQPADPACLANQDVSRLRDRAGMDLIKVSDRRALAPVATRLEAAGVHHAVEEKGVAVWVYPWARACVESIVKDVRAAIGS